jgi:hypothetical protein
MTKNIFTLALFGMLLLSCSKSENLDINDADATDINDFIPDDVERVDYELTSKNNSNVTGMASLIRNNNGTTTIFIQLKNASEGLHPATVNLGNTESNGSVAITLERCECEVSETIISKLDNGNPITFDDLMGFDGHLNIYQSPSDGTVIAEANIGSNAF